MAKQTVPTSKHDRASAAYLKGEYEKAISIQTEVINDHIKNGENTIIARKLLALYLFSSGEFDPAITLLKTLEDEIPDDSEVPENIGVMLRQSGKHVEATEYLLKAHRMAPEKFNICDGLAHSYNSLNKTDLVQKFGRMSLALKDAAADKARHWPIPDEEPPPFSYENRDRNVISFSLFGNNPRYLHGAMRNAKLAADLYPGWTCRFYCDPRVPKAVRKELEALDCQVVMRPLPDNFYRGLLWRFEVIDDPSVDRFLVRDCDSVINIKERVAVDEWLASDKWFHMMRDFPSHTELVLAGMWGGVSGVFPPLKDLEEEFKPQTAATRTFDQQLLREMVWPTMRQSVLIHDSVYTGCLGSLPFPSVGQLPPKRHVGQNEAAVIDEKKLLDSTPDRGEDLERFFLLGLPGSGTTYLQQLLNAHPGVFCPPEHHLSHIWRKSKSWSHAYQELIRKMDSKAAQQGHRIEEDKIKEELYATWLEHLFVHYAEDGVSHVGINDNQLETNLPYHAKMFPEAKFVFITRDPRDVTVALWHFKKKNDAGFDRDGSQLDHLSQSVGKEWKERVKNVQAFNRTNPGAIELVRYEDLVSPETGNSALKRLLTFLELPASGDILNSCFETIIPGGGPQDEVGAWQDALSLQQIDSIQKVASRLMKVLRYPECPVDTRSIEAGDTILPS